MDRKVTESAVRARRGQGRPAAFCLAWLRHAGEFTGVDAKGHHHAAKKDIGGAWGYALRVAARQDLIEWAKTDELVRELLDLERLPHEDEDLEPMLVP